jgi:hypothetical protein
MRNLWWHEAFVNNLTGLIICEEYNAQTTFSGILAMVRAHVNPIAINYAIFVNPVTINVVKSLQMRSWCYKELPGLLQPRETQTLH